MADTYTPVDADKARSLIGGGIHTGLRKASENGSEAWRAINDMPDADWSAVLRFLIDGLDSIGYVLCEKPNADALVVTVEQEQAPYDPEDVEAHLEANPHWPAG